MALVPKKVSQVLYELGREARADMHVPIRVFADSELMAQISRDRSTGAIRTGAPY